MTCLQKVFLEAVRQGDALQLQKLLADRQDKLNLNGYDKEGQTALHRFCSQGNLELVKLLVQSGADTGLANREGWAPVHVAVYGGHKEIAHYLVKVGIHGHANG